MAWLRLIRWPNLLIVALTQFAAWSCVILPFHKPEVLTFGNFLLLSLSTVLIAAGGYIINDYFDIRIDVINKPDKVILERDIPRRLAIIVHSVLNVVALLLAAAVALPAGHPEWLLLQLSCTALLWKYSTTWKRQFMVGNVVVSLMTALTIIALMLYEPMLSSPRADATGDHQQWLNPFAALLIFSLFAFILTWMREIVKDMEDYKGDDAEGCLTMPIQWGLLGSTRFVQALGAIAIFILLAAMVWIALHIEDPWTFIPLYFVTGTVILPLGFCLRRLQEGATSEHYHVVSRKLKEIMVFGVISLVMLSF